jgi:AraC-like DNA-binding protein
MAMKSGELYCSRHGKQKMDSLKSGVFYIKAKRLEECEPHLTRLSLNFSPDGKQHYRVNNTMYSVSPRKYLLINEGNEFSTCAEGQTESRMITLAFQAGLPAQLYADLTTSTAQCLDRQDLSNNPVFFHEQTHIMDEFLFKKLDYFSQPSASAQDTEHVQDVMEEVLVHIIAVHQEINTRIDTIDKEKLSTRQEIYRRLRAGHEYIHDHYAEAITIDMAAKHACLSGFNFKRLYKAFYHESPYQTIKRLRLQQATELLAAGMPVKQVCLEVGWQDASSFVRLFKSATGVTPNRLR